MYPISPNPTSLVVFDNFNLTNTLAVVRLSRICVLDFYWSSEFDSNQIVGHLNLI